MSSGFGTFTQVELEMASFTSLLARIFRVISQDKHRIDFYMINSDGILMSLLRGANEITKGNSEETLKWLENWLLHEQDLSKEMI
jgi:hypothetical protein